MQIEKANRSSDQIEFGIIYGSLALVTLALNRFTPITAYLPPCVFKQMTGLPCPTCGISRSVSFLSAGDVSTAIAMNPLFCLSLFIMLCIALYHLVTLVFHYPRIRPIASKQELQMVKAGAVFLVVLNWAYLILSI